MIRYGSFLLLGILLAGGCRQDGGEKTLAVTYIANEGYMISMGRTNVLIDALPMSKYYANPSDTLANRIINGVLPFDNVDYFLVTHEHSDHFNAEMASRFLKNHPAAQLIANQETCSRLNADSTAHGRFYDFSLNPGERRTYRDDKAEIVVMRLDHGGFSDLTNLAFIVRSNGYTIVHVGDAKLAHNENFLRMIDWSSYNVNVLFVEYFDQSTPTWDFIDSTMRPEHVVLMHIPPGEEESVRNANAQAHPKSVVFGREGETKRFKPT